MKEGQQRIRLFVKGFFENLGSEVVEDGNILIIQNANESFEKFYGKKAPYHFVFSPEHKEHSSELVNQGNFLLKAINDYLEGQAQTSLLKIDFGMNLDQDIKYLLSLKNCKLGNTKKTKENKILYRFTFKTTFQYLNENEQIFNSVYVKNNEIIDFDPIDYELTEGNSKEIETKQIEKSYKIAKENLKTLLEDKKNQVSSKLSNKIDSEVQRIKKHYNTLKSELDSGALKIKNQIQELEKKRLGASGDNLIEIEKRIERLENVISSRPSSEEKIKLIKEEEFAIKDEIHKHSLNIKNKLMNTTIIYYPVFTIEAFLTTNNTKQKAQRMIELKYDPLTLEVSKLHCDCCKEELKQIYLCGSGHIACSKCIARCHLCKTPVCKKCKEIICSQCNKLLCQTCSTKCRKCKKHLCKSHFIKDGLCMDCVKRCNLCQQLFDPAMLKKTQKDGSLCPKCSTQKANEDVQKIFNPLDNEDNEDEEKIKTTFRRVRVK